MKNNKKASAHNKKHECGVGVSQAEVQPWHRLGGMEHICELRKNSAVLYAIFVTILREIYATKKGRSFGCPDVLWKQDPEKTQIWIDTELRWEDMRPDFTPAIYINIGNVQYDYPPSLDAMGRVRMRHDGELHYERAGACDISIIHVSDTAGDTCAIADNTEYYLSSMQDQLAQKYCFEHVMVVGRNPLQKKDLPQSAGKEKIVSIVTLKADWIDSWMVKYESPILRSVSLVEDGSAEVEFGDISTDKDTPLLS